MQYGQSLAGVAQLHPSLGHGEVGAEQKAGMQRFQLKDIRELLHSPAGLGERTRALLAEIQVDGQQVD